MTDTQKRALKMMDDRGIGAIVTRFGWTWPVDVRENEANAEAVIEAIEKPVGMLGYTNITGVAGLWSAFAKD